MPKQTFKIEGFHGGINSSSDPRDIRDDESPNLRDIAIDSVGKIKTSGRFNTPSHGSDSNTLTILANRGLFTMSSDRQLDGNIADETLIFLYDNGSDKKIDVKDSEGWDNNKIEMDDTSIPVYYTADGVIRVSDAGLNENSQWFGYISDERFDSLNADSGAIGWYNIEQSLATPTSGKCIISTPAVGSDTNGIFSNSGEYIGTVIDDGTSSDQVANHSSVNLRVGVQIKEIIASGHADWDLNPTHIGNPSSDSTHVYPCIGTATTLLEGSSSSNTFSSIGVDGLSFTIGDDECLIVSIYITSYDPAGGLPPAYDRLNKFVIATSNIQWTFGKEEIKPDMWNLLVCSSENISLGSENFPIDSSASSFIINAHDTTNDKIDYYVSGVAIAKTQSIQAFTPNTYTFHHTYLYDVENKQESLPFKFNDLDSSSDEPDLNSINVVGSSVLFNFDTYICSNVAAGNAYGLNKRISGSRLYYKKEENDNYFLIGELDFVDKGFKFLPEADTLSYPMTDTTNTTGNILGKTALIKAISPETANTIDTFKTINGFSTEVKSLDAKYKTAVVHGRRVYIGNIKRPSGKTHPDRIVKSQVNRFDTFPEGMGSVDVVIRDGESIVKLEAYADRILQFKQHSLYIINVSESVDFLEDTFRNKGCAFDYHVVRTDIGIAWFNDHGCFIYDGRNVVDLLEKNRIRIISESDWSDHVTDAEDGSADDTTMAYSHIAYIPKKKQLMIKNMDKDAYVFDFVLKSWTYIRNVLVSLTDGVTHSNFALDADQNLFTIEGTTSRFTTYQTSSQDTQALIYNTKDIDFGQPSIRKKIYRVRINYKGDADNIVVKYSINGNTNTPYDFEGTNSSTGKPTGSSATSSKPLYDKTDLTQWHQAELKPDVSSEANNVYSFQLSLSGSCGASFEVNDITIIYRLKNVR